MRPKSIETFEKAYLASIAVSAVGLALGWDRLTGQASAALPNGGATGLAIISAVVGFGISLLLWYFIARRASNVARWIMVIFTAIGLFSFLSSLFLPTVPKDLQTVIGAVSTALSVFAAWQLFRPDAVAWLESKGGDGPADPTTFE